MKKRFFGKLFAVLCVTVLVAVSLVLFASAKTYSGECGAEGSNVTWTFDEATGTLAISGEGAMADFYGKVPWNDYRYSIVEIEISEGITKIGYGAFANTCITEIYIPASVEQIGRWSFAVCKKLEKYTVSEENEIFTVKNNCIVDINGNLVTGCKNSLIPDDGSIINIGYGAFHGHDIYSVTIPSSVKTIGNQAFYYTPISEIHIPENVQSIGQLAFGYCKTLETMTVDDNNRTYYDMNNCIITKSTKVVVSGCKTSTIPTDVTGIAAYAFADNRGMKNIIVPASVTMIGNGAFRNSGLSAIMISNPNARIYDDASTIPTSAIIYGTKDSTAHAYADKYGRTFVDDLKFAGGTCGADSDDVRWALDFETGVLTISGNGAINDTSAGVTAWLNFRSKIKSVKIENGVSEIGNFAFSSCYNLESIEIPDSVVRIGVGAFAWCSKLVSVNIPASVTTIDTNGNSMICGCTSLVSVTVDANNPKFYALDNFIVEKGTDKLVTGAGSGIIPEGIKSIGAYAFAVYTVSKIHIPASVESIDSTAFFAMGGTTEITVDPLNAVYFTNGEMLIKKSNNSVIWVLPGLESVTVPSYVTSLSASLFRFCTNLKEVKVDADNPVYFADDNCIIRKDNNKLILSNRDGKIPDYVTIIGQAAFNGISGITSLTIPENVKQIDSYAFYWCDDLTSITINGFIDYVGKYAFVTNPSGNVKVTFTKQKNELSTWSADWSNNIPGNKGKITVTFGDELYVPEGYHECKNSQVSQFYWRIDKGTPVFGCEVCGKKADYTLSENPILNLDFETHIEDSVNDDLKVSYRKGHPGEYFDKGDGTKVYKPYLATLINDSNAHLMFAPEKLRVSLDIKFDLDAIGNVEKESILTFIYGCKGDMTIGTTTGYNWVLRYYKGADGVAKLGFSDNPAPENCVIIEDEKWYHCEVIADGGAYTIFINGVKIGMKERLDYTLEKYNGGTTLRIADGKGTVAAFDNLVITQINSPDCGDGNHKYTNVCDAECNVCGAEREALHEFKSNIMYGAFTHWNECALCYAKANEADHQYDSVTDTTCNVCNFERVLVHEYENFYSYDENVHYVKCLHCGGRKNEAEHDYDNACDTTCNTCTYEREITHTYEWEYNSDEHWEKCSVCGVTGESHGHNDVLKYSEFYHWAECSECGYKSVMSSHDYTTDCDSTCNTCGSVRSVSHDFEDKWSFDGYSHWYACKNNCGQKKDEAPHTWDNGAVLAPGFVTYTCKACAATKNEVVVNPENAPMVVIESKGAIAGTTITVSVSLKNIPAVKSMMLDEFVYDEEVFELVRGKWLVDDAEIANWDLKDKVATLALSADTELDGAVFELTFKVKDDVEGEFELSCDATIKKKAAVGGEEIVNAALVKGVISVSTIARGDVNGNGFVDSDDAIYLLRHTLKADDYPINQSGDMNGDGFVDSDDAIYLLRYTLKPDQYPIK